ncbi:unnamed protein product, partial [Eruca vesicaria subsp. sativa]|nr:unnamed protein product [Eruca vesicaria subsp. sativa]
MPLVFKRTSNNNNTSSSTSSHRPRPKTNSQKNPSIGSTKSPTPPSRFPLTSPNRSASSGRSSLMKPSIRSSSTVRGMVWERSVSKSDDEDSEDDKPLRARLKGYSNQHNKQGSSSTRGSSQLPVQWSNVRPQGVNDNSRKRYSDEK